MALVSTSRSTDDQDDAGVVVGVIRGAHGLSGEVRVEPLTDAFDLRFRTGAKLLCDGVELTIEAMRGTPQGPILRFRGHETREAAEALRNKDLRVPTDEARRAAGDGYLWKDLIGMSVATPDGTRLGEVSDLLRAGGTDVLVVRDGTREVMLPMIESVVRTIDRDARNIVAIPQEEA